MRVLLLPAALLILTACGGPADNGTATGDQTSDESSDQIVLERETHYVADADLPTYESVPLPDGLVWQTNDEDPVFASPDAKSGGTFTLYETSFPLTLRQHGPDSNSGSIAILRRGNFLSLIDIHPNTLNPIPVLATHWAFGDDGKTVYYKLNPKATFSDGVPITADDYVFAREMRLSQYVVDPYGQNYFTNVITDVRKHDDYTISVVHNSKRPPIELLLETAMGPEPRHFHKLDENWVTDYNWRIEPNTGPYMISSLENGRYIEWTRNKNWWGNDLKYFQHRFNPDKVRVEIIRDENVAFEYFLRGDLDRYLFETLPARWYDQAKGPVFDNGYAGKIQYYTDTPREPFGLWLNMDDPLLADKNVREGLAYSINMDRALKTIFRGDYERLQSRWQGYYWGYSDPNIHVRQFDIDKADSYFDAAGWTERGPDGIRMKNGQRLSVRISYGTDDHTPWLVILREEARKAGIELALQLMDPAAWGRQVGEKKFQITVLRFTTNMTPSFWQGYDSSNAHQPNTNNITNTDDPEVDQLIDGYENAATLEERTRYSWEIQQKLYDMANFIPLYNRPYIRETFWRWVKLPETHATRISGEVFEPFGSGLFWIDEDAKAETLAAEEQGRTFPPINIVDTTWRVD